MTLTTFSLGQPSDLVKRLLQHAFDYTVDSNVLHGYSQCHVPSFIVVVNETLESQSLPVEQDWITFDTEDQRMSMCLIQITEPCKRRTPEEL